RLTGFRFVPFDPVLRDRQADASRRQAWLRDQYVHPEEHRHAAGEVLSWFSDDRVEYLRTFPSVVFGDDSGELFAPAADDWSVETWLAQVGWVWTLGHEGGALFRMRRRESR